MLTLRLFVETHVGPCRPCKPSKTWALLHRLPYFSRPAGKSRAVRACVRARVHLRRFWKRLCVLSALALRSRSFWVLSCLGWTLFSVFLPSPTATIKKTNPSTMATSYINSQYLCLSLPYHDILGRYWLHKKRRQTNWLLWTVTYAPSAITFNCDL